MPAKSAKQERFMQAVAHNPKFAKKAGVPQSVGREFTKSSAEGGAMKAKKLPPFMGKESKAEEAKEKKMSKAAYMRGERAEGEKMARGGGVERKGKTVGKIVKMKKGGRCG